MPKFKLKDLKNNIVNNKEIAKSDKKANIFRIPPPISLRPSKRMLEKSKFYQGKEKTLTFRLTYKKGQSYIQAFKSNIKNIVKIKKNFPNLSAKKSEEIYKVLNGPKKNKPRLDMMTKGLSRKQVLVSISSNNLDKFIILSSKHIANINRALKNIKSDVIADFI